MTRKRCNIRPNLVGELFTDGTDYFRLIDCQSEPIATFQNIAFSSPDKHIITKPISECSNLVLLKPVYPRKLRSDTGTTHKKREAARNQAQKEIPTPKEAATKPASRTRRRRKSKGPDISTFVIKTPQPSLDEPVIMMIDETSIDGRTYSECAGNLLVALGIDREYVAEAPDSEGKRELLSILGK